MTKPNLGQTILIAIAVFTLTSGCIALLSFANIHKLQQEVTVVERVDDLRDLILEIRYNAKSFFLYHDRAMLQKNKANVARAASILDELSAQQSRSGHAVHEIAIRQGLADYAALLDRLDAASGAVSAREPDGLALRGTGQRLLDHARAIAALERQNALVIHQRLHTILILVLAAVVLVGLVLVIFVFRRVLGPLQQVREATQEIAQGTFAPRPAPRGPDEIRQVFEALNTMEKELRKRQVQLVQAQKLSSIGTLASGIAHQLNNPLNNISTSAQIVSEDSGEKSALAEKMMRNITQETLRARNIVKGLLDFSRPRGFSLAPGPLAPVLQGAARLAAGQIGPNITVTLNVPEDLILHMDGQRLQEAFINLLLNASQAIGRRQGRIEVTATDKTEQVLITMADTGDGMSEKTLQRLFDPFFSTKPVGRGTGLGLSIVYGIIEEHGGSIRVESRPGSGSVFFIQLPKQPEEATA